MTTKPRATETTIPTTDRGNVQRVEPPALLTPFVSQRRARYQSIGGRDDLTAFHAACAQYADDLRQAGEEKLAQSYERAAGLFGRYAAMPHPLPVALLRSVAARLDRLADVSTFSDSAKEFRGQAPASTIEPVAQVMACLHPPVRFFTRGAVVAQVGGRWRRVTNSVALGVLRAWVVAGGLQPAIKQPLVTVSGGENGKMDVHEEAMDVTEGDSTLYPLLAGKRGLPHIERWAVMLTDRQDTRLLQHLATQDGLHVQTGAGDDWLLADPPGMLGTPDGVYDLHTGTLAEGQPSLYLRSTGVTPAETADEDTCPRFLSALERALPDEAERDYLQLLCGYALTGEYSADVAMMFLGPSRTGKSTVVEALRAVFGVDGGYAAKVENEKMLRSKAHFPRLTELRDKRLGILTEMDRRYAWDAGRFKALTGGGRFTGQSSNPLELEQDWRPQFTLLIETNEAPMFGSTVGVGERLRVFRFNRVLDNEDTTIRATMPVQEASGVLRWVLDGARRFYADPSALQHRRAPESIRRATRAVLLQDDPEQAFYSGLAPSHKAMPFARLYEQLEQLCAIARKPTPSRIAVGARLRADGFALHEGRGHQRVVYAQLAYDLNDD